MAEFDKIKKSAERLGAQSEEALTKARDVVSKLTEEVTSRGEDIAEEVKEKGGELLDEAKARGEEALKGLTKWASKNPGAAIAGGVLLGILVTALFSRDKD